MARYNFNLKNKELIDDMRSPAVYEYNMAQNLAMLSNDPSVIRRFFEVQIPKYFKDTWLTMEADRMFLRQYLPGQAFAYFGIIPMIVNAKVNLVASNGFKCESDDEEIDEVLNELIDEAELQKKFCDGVYWESGIGDVAFRISFCPDVCDRPIIDIIEPQHLEVNYRRGKIKSFVIKEVSKDDASYELREIHYKNDEGYACIDYRFAIDGKYVPKNDEAKMQECREKFPPDIDMTPRQFPLKDFLIIFKKNDNSNQLYKGERGVPDIQGLASIEDALTESISDLIDAIRKGGIKEFISDELIPQDAEGNDLRLNHFNKTIITTKGSASPGDNSALWNVVQGDIKWEAYTKTIQNLMSTAINKAGLSPTTLGLTGLESINSSQESQDAREKPSMRTREIALNGWRKTLKDLLNRYLQVRDYIDGKEIVDYSSLISITFNEYTNPTVENVTDVLVKQVEGGIKAPLTAIKELNKGISDEEAEEELLQIFASKGVETIDEGGNGDETDSAEPAEGSEEEREDDPTENSAP
jgi:hypothetical protein|nr:MAG TPA: portal protein [Caudoviricetes sp.]